MTYRNPSDWMWAQAFELIEEADRMHRQFFRLATSERTQAVWAPPVDVFDDEQVIALDMFVEACGIELDGTPGKERLLAAAATRPIAEAGFRYPVDRVACGADEMARGIHGCEWERGVKR